MVKRVYKWKGCDEYERAKIRLIHLAWRHHKVTIILADTRDDYCRWGHCRVRPLPSHPAAESVSKAFFPFVSFLISHSCNSRCCSWQMPRWVQRGMERTPECQMPKQMPKWGVRSCVGYQRTKRMKMRAPFIYNPRHKFCLWSLIKMLTWFVVCFEKLSDG